MTTSDIGGALTEMAGREVSEATISAVTDNVLPLAEVCPVVYLDAINVKLPCTLC